VDPGRQPRGCACPSAGWACVCVQDARAGLAPSRLPAPSSSVVPGDAPPGGGRGRMPGCDSRDHGGFCGLAARPMLGLIGLVCARCVPVRAGLCCARVCRVRCGACVRQGCFHPPPKDDFSPRSAHDTLGTLRLRQRRKQRCRVRGVRGWAWRYVLHLRERSYHIENVRARWRVSALQLCVPSARAPPRSV